jgi:hypothetical protein
MAPRVRLLEHLITWTTVALFPAVVWLFTGSPWLLFLATNLALVGVAVAVVYDWFYLPQFCMVEGRRALLKTPGRRIEVEFLEEPKLVEAGIWPRKRVFLGIGYRFSTLHAVFGDEYFFSTPNCDKTWLVARARVGNKEKKVWLCGCTLK